MTSIKKSERRETQRRKAKQRMSSLSDQLKRARPRARKSSLHVTRKG